MIDTLPVCTSCVPAGADDAGNLYVFPQRGQGGLYRYQPTGELVSLFQESGETGGRAGETKMSPSDVDVDPAGNLWIASGDRVFRVSPEGEAEAFLGSSAGPAPRGPNWALRVAADPEGNAYVAGQIDSQATFNNRDTRPTRYGVWKISKAGSVSVLVRPPAGGPALSEGVSQAVSPALSNISDLAATVNQDVYFTAREEATRMIGIYVLRVNGDLELTTLSGDLTVDQDRNLWVAGVQIAPDGSVARTRPGGFPKPPRGVNFSNFVFGNGDELFFISSLFGQSLSRQPSGGEVQLLLRGSSSAFGGSGGTLESARIWPQALAADSDRALYIADSNHGVVWKMAETSPGQPLFASDAVLNAASFKLDRLAPDTWISIFGKNLAEETVLADSDPLPTELGGVSVSVTDSEGTSRPASLQIVLPGQINARIPAETALGPAEIIVRTTRGESPPQEFEIRSTAPGLFSAKSNGQGVAAAFFLRVGPDGSQTSGPMSKLDEETQEIIFESVPINSDFDQLFLILFGTGIRGADSVEVRIDGVEIPVSFFGPQGVFEGLDQVNIGPLPNALKERPGVKGIELVADGRAANVVLVGLF